MSEQTNKAGETSGQSVPKSGKSKFRQKSQQEQTAESKLRMEKRGEKLDAAKDKLAKQKPLKKPGPVKRAGRVVSGGVHGFVHGKIYENEHENVGIEGAHRSELVGETALRHGTRFVKKEIREHPARAVRRAEVKNIRATADYQFRMAAQEHPELDENAFSRYLQKRRIQKQYVKQVREAAKQGAKATEQAAVTTEKLAARAAGFFKRHSGGCLIALCCVLLMMVMQSCVSSLVTLGNGTIGAIAASTYAAEDEDLRGAEAAYTAKETELRRYLNTYEWTHGYDEYHYDLDEIEHDPYVLPSMISALHEGAWTLDAVADTLQTLFDRQYTLTERVVVHTYSDGEGGTYHYYIAYVTLRNFNLSHLPIYMMGEDQLSRYALYMATLGNRPDLFPSSGYVDKYITNGPTLHEVPESYLADETFAAIWEEAERYIGYPYVWGGYQPSTSFDCSGFVSYVYNQCGWDFGRLGAQGLYNISTRTNNPKPGDLVFFTGTYDVTGVSHCGIYVGDGWMLDAGDPIGYSNLNTSYWQSHLYAYGKLY